jgi:hypothetical protein
VLSVEFSDKSQESYIMLNIRYFAPHPQLRHLIRSYYIFEVTASQSVVMQDRLITEYANFRAIFGGNMQVCTSKSGTISAPSLCISGPNSTPNDVTVTGGFKLFGKMCWSLKQSQRFSILLKHPPMMMLL